MMTVPWSMKSSEDLEDLSITLLIPRMMMGALMVLVISHSGLGNNSSPYQDQHWEEDQGFVHCDEGLKTIVIMLAES